MSLTARQEIENVANQYGWKQAGRPGDWWEPVEYQRRNGRGTAFVRLTFTMLGGVKSLSYGPQLDGQGGGVGITHKRERAIAMLMTSPRGRS